MPRKDQNSYGTQGQTNYAPDQQNQYQKNPPPTPEEAYQAKHDSRFTKQLSTIGRPRDLQQQEEHPGLPGRPQTRRRRQGRRRPGRLRRRLQQDHLRLRLGPPRGASAVADTTFQPLYKQVEQLEAKDELALDPNIAAALKRRASSTPSFKTTTAPPS